VHELGRTPFLHRTIITRRKDPKSCQAPGVGTGRFSVPLVRMLLALTVVTGVVDAVSFLFQTGSDDL